MKYSLLLIVLLSLPFAWGVEGAMPLLAVQEEEGEMIGSTAKLTLELTEGSGRVFVDTFPLSKIDTQISMRFAKEIACNLLDRDCEEFDFIYTIKANSPIIGGPSAGAAATALTVLVLEEEHIDQKIAITGTINSGGLVGPVGGIKEKVEAAAEDGITTVLIPQGKRDEMVNESENETINLVELGLELGIVVEEVADLYQILEVYTGESFEIDYEIAISQNYEETMKVLAERLCERNEKIKDSLGRVNRSKELYKWAKNLSRDGKDAYEREQFYSAASFCFGSNVRYNQLFLEEKDVENERYEDLFEELEEEIEEFEKKIEKLPIRTISDLESFMIVKERLTEAKKFLNNTENASYEYAYANERLQSAYSWSKFHQNKGKELELDDKALRDTCRQRIAETEERLQYAKIYVPFPLPSPQEELDLAYADFDNEEYALCLFKATKAKAEVNIVLNTLGVRNDFVPTLIDNKLVAASRVIQKAESQDIFPILGYSYYEYATNLKEDDPFSALLYAEYALELSNLDIYFKEKEKQDFSSAKIPTSLFWFLIGMVVMIPFIFLGRKAKRK